MYKRTTKRQTFNNRQSRRQFRPEKKSGPVREQCFTTRADPTCAPATPKQLDYLASLLDDAFWHCIAASDIIGMVLDRTNLNAHNLSIASADQAIRQLVDARRNNWGRGY